MSSLSTLITDLESLLKQAREAQQENQHNLQTSSSNLESDTQEVMRNALANGTPATEVMEMIANLSKQRESLPSQDKSQQIEDTLRSQLAERVKEVPEPTKTTTVSWVFSFFQGKKNSSPKKLSESPIVSSSDNVPH